MKTRNDLSLYVAASFAALALAACSPADNTTAGQRTNSTVGSTTDATRSATTTVATGASDMMITAKVKTALAANSNVSALKIDVDTKEGRVALTGTAPNAAARDTATTLVNGVEGVRGVDNRLVVAANG